MPVLKSLVAAGHKLILNTMRCGRELQAAVDWFKQNDIPLYGVNKDPGQSKWTQSPKVFANMYIDDAALGCPLLYPIKGALPPDDKASGRPYVDWEKIAELFAENNYYQSPDPIKKEE